MKKLLAMVLALVMALGVTTMAWAADPETEKGYRDGGNGYAELPAAPTEANGVINVTAANAQYTLDGAYGSIDGKTINFTESISSVLLLGRPTKYAGSNTEYYVGGFDETAENYQKFDTAEALAAHKSSNGWTAKCYYYRTISGVKFTAAAGVTLAGFSTDGATGHVYGSEAKPIYDYVRDSGTWCKDTNSSYNAALTMRNVTFEGLTVNSNSGFAFNLDITSTDGKQNVVQGIKFVNCTLNSSARGTAYFLNNGGTADVFSDIAFDNCKLTVSESSEANTYGVLAQGIKNLTVNKCTLTGMERAVQCQQSGGEGSVQQPNGTLTVTNNTFDGIIKYIIRSQSTTDLTGLTITGNTAKNSGDGCKILLGGDNDDSYKGSGTTAIYSNDWDENVNHASQWTQNTEAPQQPPRYYYNSTTTTTDTKKDETKGSPKTFDAGVGIYAVSAVLSVTGMAYVGKKKF